MPLKYTTNCWPSFQVIPTITKALRNTMSQDQINEFFEYLSNTDVTWGSPDTTVLLKTKRFKRIIKEFLIYLNNDNRYFGLPFTNVWRKISNKLYLHKYVIIK